MKPLQLVTFTVISTVILLLWSLFFWQIIANSADVNPADKPQLERLERAMDDIRDLAKPVTQKASPHFMAQQQEPWIDRIIFGSILYAGLSLLTGILVWMSGLFRQSIMQRWLSISGFGLLGTVVFRLSDPRWLNQPWMDSLWAGVFDLVFWLLIGLIAALQLRIKKRNIFSN